eukprot:gnl/Spiro4/8015_TR4215_c0_g1_i1.p1 gnl/Spiro4/8015_TR4215_c0_g1~~gnl/Spiro4/8015_TR4215_c0_g1_i1.p1  ORF type:complete len:423 (+),score=74.74 gnl/Spiro4/8015_TR4215_c0_g1_i1:39-1271(+)
MTDVHHSSSSTSKRSPVNNAKEKKEVPVKKVAPVDPIFAPIGRQLVPQSAYCGVGLPIGCLDKTASKSTLTHAPRYRCTGPKPTDGSVRVVAPTVVGRGHHAMSTDVAVLSPSHMFVKRPQRLTDYRGLPFKRGASLTNGLSTLDTTGKLPVEFVPEDRKTKVLGSQTKIGDRLVPCPHCRQDEKYSNLEAHVQNECPDAPVTCQHCFIGMKRSQLPVHLVDSCDRRQIKCNLCGATDVIARDLENHKRRCTTMKESREALYAMVPYIGLTAVRPDKGFGVLLKNVEANTSADSAQLRAGDLVTRIEGATFDFKIPDVPTFKAACNYLYPGSRTSWYINRAGTPLKVELTASVPGVPQSRVRELIELAQFGQQQNENFAMLFREYGKVVLSTLPPPPTGKGRRLSGGRQQ